MTINRKLIVLFIILLIVFIATEVLYQVSYPMKYQEYILKYSDEYDVDPYLLTAIINTESNFNKDAASHKGAMGLMQLTESTAHWIAESMGEEDFSTGDLYDPEINIKMGSWYIDNIRKEFGTTELVLAAYNAGRGNVQKWIGSAVITEDERDYSKIPFKETEKYIEKVLANQQIYRILYNIE